MGGTKATEETYTRHLPYQIICKLTTFLDIGDMWEKIVLNIPRRLRTLETSNVEFEAKYDSLFVASVRDRSRCPGVSPSRLVLDEWSTQNVKVKHLIAVLIRCELYGPADMLAVDLLKGSPVPRPTHLPTTANMPGLVYDRLQTDGRNLSQQEQYEQSSTVYERFHDVSEQSVHVNRLSIVSGQPSVDLKSGDRVLSAGESDEIWEVGNNLRDGQLQCLRQLDYKLLQSVTDNFNDKDIVDGGNLIGHGGFGKVFIGRFKNGFHIAVKCLKEENEDNLKQFKTELESLSTYRHENIVHLLGYSQQDSNYSLIYQYMVNGSLEDRLMCKNQTEALTCAQRLSIALGTASGIEFLNDKGLVHRDIKSANVLLDKDFEPKVGDFATIRKAPKGTGASLAMTQEVIGTPAYIAPEAYQFDISAKLDTFSFGVVLLELITGLPSFEESREERDLWSHVQEECSNIMDIVDHKAGPWLEKLAEGMFTIAKQCFLRKRLRPLVSDIIPKLKELS